jgi:SAM-dependent methyltransferase
MKEEEIRNRQTFARYLDLVLEDIEAFFSEPGLFALLPCPACYGREHETQFLKAGFRYVECKACRTLFVNPRPSAPALMKFYVESASSRYWVDEFFLPVAEARREKVFRPRALYVSERLPELCRGLIGDIGAGFGLFLEELRGVWPDCRLVAIEPSPEMAALCRAKDLQVIETTIENVEGNAGTFDLITSFELLEHLHEPRAMLAKTYDLLRPGGYLLATTLNGQGFDIQVLWEKSKSVSPPHHLNFLNPRSLAKLCESVGFHIEEVSTPGRLDWDIVQGAITNDQADAGRLWRLLAERGSEDAKEELQVWLVRHALSSHMRVLARK